MPEVVVAKPRQVPANGKFNKNAARQVHGAGKESVAIELDPKQILRILHSESGHNTIFDCDITGQGVAKVMIVDWQYEPIRDSLLHIDLKRIAMDKAMKASVPVRLIGVANGVKNEGGMLDQVLREVEIECLPGDIPSHIDVDISGLGLHQAIRVSDLPHSGVAHVVSIRAEAEPVAVVPAVAEPEVAKKGKTDAPATDAKDAKK
jgi:large subunit ribosomal protein L25